MLWQFSVLEEQSSSCACCDAELAKGMELGVSQHANFGLRWVLKNFLGNTVNTPSR